MPELPEVETIRRGLSDVVLRKKIVKMEVFCDKSCIGDAEKVVGAEIFGVKRRGKALLFELSNEMVMMVHLRMTGQMIFVGKERFAGGHPSENFLAELPNGQTRVMWIFDDGSKMYFNDQRKFGFVKIIEKNQVENEEFLRKLGKEPWEMSGEELYKKFIQKHTTVKAALLDQTIMAGLGNIYADETLYLSGVRAEKQCDKICIQDCKKIVQNARNVMEKSIECGGSTIRNYVKADGTRGDYLKLFAKVYGREGERCEKCGGIIKKTRVAGRGTYYCEECQK